MYETTVSEALRSEYRFYLRVYAVLSKNPKRNKKILQELQTKMDFIEHIYK